MSTVGSLYKKKEVKCRHWTTVLKKKSNVDSWTTVLKKRRVKCRQLDHCTKKKKKKGKCRQSDLWAKMSTVGPMHHGFFCRLGCYNLLILIPILPHSPNEIFSVHCRAKPLLLLPPPQKKQQPQTKQNPTPRQKQIERKPKQNTKTKTHTPQVIKRLEESNLPSELSKFRCKDFTVH